VRKYVIHSELFTDYRQLVIDQLDAGNHSMTESVSFSFLTES